MSLSISELEAAIDRLYQGPIAEFTQPETRSPPSARRPATRPAPRA
jgi:hypothetical protein